MCVEEDKSEKEGREGWREEEEEGMVKDSISMNRSQHI